MSRGQKIKRALKKAEYRDKKRQTRMKVSGKSVLRLAQLIDKPKKSK